MATEHAETHAQQPDGATRILRRRGLLAAAVAVMAGLVAKITEQPVEAGVDGDVVLGAANTTASDTSIACTATDGTGLLGQCTAGLNGRGVYGIGSGVGTLSLATNTSGGTGVYGSTYGSGTGVWGNNLFDNGIGVRGESVGESSFGVFGLSSSWHAVRGQIPGDSSAGAAIAVYGENMSTGNRGTPGGGGFGCYGFSLNGAGLVGATGTAGGAAVVGSTNGIPGAYAGVFYGPFVVVDGPKSAAVAHPDGSHRLLYCLESPESWFEDFGKAQLECGFAEVAIDPDFAAVVDLDDYHVFVTPYGAAGLFVKEQTARGFRVEAADPTSTTRFSWRLVAKRRDIPGERLAAVTLPPEPTRPPDLPASITSARPPAFKPPHSRG